MGLAKAMLLFQIGNLLGVFEVCNLFHYRMPEAHWLAVLGLNLWKVRGAIAFVCSHLFLIYLGAAGLWPQP